MADKDDSGIAWVAVPAGREGDKLRLSIWVCPRMQGTKSNPQPQDLTPAQKELQRIFGDWSSLIRSVRALEMRHKRAKFQVRFYDKNGVPGPVTEAVVDPSASEFDDDWSEAWNALFKSVGPFKVSARTLAATSPGLNLRARVTPLAPDLTPEDFLNAAPGWERKVAPKATVSYSAAALVKATRDVTVEAHGELFGSPVKRLRSVSYEKRFRLPRRRPANGSSGAAASGIADDWISDVHQLAAPLFNSARPDPQDLALREMSASLARVLNAFPVPAQVVGLTVSGLSLESAAKAERSARFHRHLHRLRFDDFLAGQDQDATHQAALQAVFAPVLHRVKLSNLKALGQITDEETSRLARAEATAFFGRTGLRPAWADVEAQRLAAEPSWKDYDFFQRLTMIQSYRGLLRPLGLVFDLIVDWPTGAAEVGMVDVAPPQELAPQYALPTRTAYELGPRTFHAARRGRVPLQGVAHPIRTAGLLEGGLVKLGADDAFTLETLDHDQIATRLILSAETQEDLNVAELPTAAPGKILAEAANEATRGARALLGLSSQTTGNDTLHAKLSLKSEGLFGQVQALVTRLAEKGPLPAFPPGTAIAKTFAILPGKAPMPVYVRPFLKGQAVYGLSLALGDEAHTAVGRALTPHPRRSYGFSVLWNDSAEFLAAVKQREIAQEANRLDPKVGYVLADEEDLLAGLTPEVRFVRPTPSGLEYSGWAPLCVRQETYFAKLSVETYAPIQSGAFQAVDIAPGQPDPPGEDHVAPALFHWSGGLLSVTSNFKSLRNPGDLEVTAHSDWVSVQAPKGKARPLYYSVPDESGAAPTYQFRVRAYNRANRFVDELYPQAPQEDVQFVLGGSLLRQDPLAPPRVLMPFEVAREVVAHTPEKPKQRPAVAQRDLAGNARDDAPPWDQRAPLIMVVRDGKGSDLRWVAPGRSSVDFCARYPVFEGLSSLRAAGTFREARVDAVTGDFPTYLDLKENGELKPHPKDRKGKGGPPVYVEGWGDANSDTPYYPDPAAQSVAVELRDETEPGVALDPDSGRVVLVPLYGKTFKWPHARVFQIEFRALGHRDPPLPMALDWDEDRRVLRIDLPPGRTAKLRLSTSPAKTLEDLSAVRQMAIHAEVASSLGPAKPRFERWTAAGGNPEISPPEVITLVHAVEKPLLAPQIGALHVHRDRDKLKTDGRLGFDIMTDGRTSSQVELTARWKDAIDDPNEPAPRYPDASLPVSPFVLDDPTLPALEADTNSYRQAPPDAPGLARVLSSPRRAAVLPFHDTRRYTIKCEAVAKSRYRTHYSEDMPHKPGAPRHSFGIASALVDFDVPSAAPPPDPKPTYVIPTFGWDAKTDKNPYGKGKRGLSWRYGGGVRVYMERGMYGSGPEEKIGVLLLDKSSWGDPERAPVEHLVTRWGADPLHGDPGYPFSPEVGDFLNGTTVPCFCVPPEAPSTKLEDAKPGFGNPRADEFSSEWTPAGTAPVVPLELVSANGDPQTEAHYPKAGKPGAGLNFNLISYEPTYDAEVGKWYFDIVLNTGARKYFPFVKFAIVRYQPWSLRGMHLSKVSLLDFVQPAPDRCVAVTRYQDETVRRGMRVVVTGPDRRGPDGSFAQVPANLVQVLVQRRAHESQTWIIDSNVEVRAPKQPLTSTGEGRVLKDIVLNFLGGGGGGVGHRRIVVMEMEEHQDGELYEPTYSQRVIYADALDLRREVFWD